MMGDDRATFSFGFFEGGPTTTTNAAPAASAPAAAAAPGANGREDGESPPSPPPPPLPPPVAAAACAEARELTAADRNAADANFAATPIDVAPGVTLLKGTVAGEAAAAALLAGQPEPGEGEGCDTDKGEEGGEEGRRQRRRQQRAGEENERRRRLLADSDLVRGAYEGGFKLWEGALDLCARLAATDQQGPSLLARIAEAATAATAEAAATGGGPTAATPPAALRRRRRPRVLELGCGHGLPGVLCLLAGADVDFQDYNAEVLERLTRPNVEANLASDAAQRGVRSASAASAATKAAAKADKAVSAAEEGGGGAPACAAAGAAVVPGRARYFAGDWRGLPALLRRLAEHEAQGEAGGGAAEEAAAAPATESDRGGGGGAGEGGRPAAPPCSSSEPSRDRLSHHYDLVLTAETLYRTDESGQPALLAALEASVGPPPSAALVASKTHYFGVGGGTADFRRLLVLKGRAAAAGSGARAREDADGGRGGSGGGGCRPLPPLAVDEAGSTVLQDGASNRREVLRLERRSRGIAEEEGD